MRVNSRNSFGRGKPKPAVDCSRSYGKRLALSRKAAQAVARVKRFASHAIRRRRKRLFQLFATCPEDGERPGNPKRPIVVFNETRYGVPRQPVLLCDRREVAVLEPAQPAVPA